MDVAHDHPRAAGRERRQHRHHADRPRADHHREVARLHLHLGRGVHADGERLDHRAFGVADVVGQLEGEVGRVDHGRPQHAMHRRRRPEAHRRVEVVLAEPRRPAARVGDAGLHADPVADLELGHGRPDLDHVARRLVAQDHRLLDDERADGAVRVVVDVAAAHPHGPERDPHVAWPQPLLDREVAQLDLVLAFQHQRLHVLISSQSLHHRRRVRRSGLEGWRASRPHTGRDRRSGPLCHASSHREGEGGPDDTR